MVYANSNCSDWCEHPRGMILSFHVHYSRPSNKIFVAYSMYLAFFFVLVYNMNFFISELDKISTDVSALKPYIKVAFDID